MARDPLPHGMKGFLQFLVVVGPCLACSPCWCHPWCLCSNGFRACFGLVRFAPELSGVGCYGSMLLEVS